MIRRNVVANFLGQAFNAAMGFAFVPVYVDYIGVESYGVIGFVSTLSSFLVLLDLGLVAALTRELSRGLGPDGPPSSLRQTLRSVEVVLCIIALIIVGVMWIASDWMATRWLELNRLDPDSVAAAARVAGFVIGLRLVETMYRSCLFGLQAQVVANVLGAVLSALRAVGAVGMLAWISPTLGAFLAWQGIVAVIGVACMAKAVYSRLPRSSVRATLSLLGLAPLRGFAAGVILSTSISLLLTHADRLLLSHLLSTEQLGFYTMAVVLAGLPAMVAGPVGQAVYPRLCQLHAEGDDRRFESTFHGAAGLASVLLGSMAVTVNVLADDLLWVWTRDAEIVAACTPLLRIMVVSSMLAGLAWIPFQAQLAHGWISLNLRASICVGVVYLPAMYFAASLSGSTGAAWAWCLACLVSISIVPAVMFRRIMPGQWRRWALRDVVVPISMCAAVSATIRFGIDLRAASTEGKAALISATWLASVIAGALTLSPVRTWLSRLARRSLHEG